jgi:K+-transporting ATPase KdpF subunit
LLYDTDLRGTVERERPLPRILFTPAPPRGHAANVPIHTMLPIATVVALLLAVYLVVAMLAPEWFA